MNRIVTVAAASALAALIAGSALAVEVPYTGNGDPMGLTSSNSPVAFEALVAEVPYTGNGDPLGLVSGGTGIDFDVRTGGTARSTQVPYTGFGDPDDLI